MIASTTSGGGCRGGARSRFVNLGMLLAHVMLPGSRHGCPRRAADALFVFSCFLLLAPLDVVIFASSNLCVQFCVSTTSRLHPAGPLPVRQRRADWQAYSVRHCLL